MNKVILMGRLTRDPEVRYSGGEKSIAISRYTLAVNRSFKREGEPDADFINIVALGRQGEFAERYLRKGQLISLVGRLQIRTYDDKEGKRQYFTEVVAEEHYFAESKSSASNHEGNFGMDRKPNPGLASGDGFMNIPDGIDEELPFN